MQGLVTLDFGNTNPHAGLFTKSQNKWQLLQVVPWQDLPSHLQHHNLTPHNAQLVLAEVKSREEELLPLLKQGFLLTRVKEYWRGKRFAGMPVDYADTLGEDRLILAYHAYKTDPTPSLIVDAGTFTTLDVVDGQGLRGGFIIPGTKNYFSTFSQGQQLKDVGLSPVQLQSLPHTTHDAMAGGYTAFGALAKDLINSYDLKKIVLTGGQSSLWRAFFKDLAGSIPVQEGPHLIHLALHHWMTTQIEPV